MEKRTFERMLGSMQRQREPAEGAETSSLVAAMDRTREAALRIAAIETGPQPRVSSRGGADNHRLAIDDIVARIKIEPQVIAELRAQQPGVTTPSSESLPNLVARVLREVRENASSARPNPSTEIK